MLNIFTTYVTRILLLILFLGTIQQVTLAQCPDAPASDDKGIFSINGKDVNPIIGDGDNISTSPNNIITNFFCPGQKIELKDLVVGGQSRSFEVTQNNTVLSTSAAIPVPAGSNSITYTLPTTTGVYYLKSFGSDAGKGYYACQVIQIVAIEKPKYTIRICSDPVRSTNTAYLTLLDEPSNKLFYQYLYSFTSFGNNPIGRTVTVSTYPRTEQFDINSGSGPFDFIISGETDTGDCDSQDQKQLSPLPTVNQSLLYDISIGNQISLNVSGTPSTEHKIWMRDPTTESSYNTSSGTPVHTYTPTTNSGEVQLFSIPDKSKQYCFKVSASDLCNSTTVESFNEICTTPIVGNTVRGGNTISWKTAQSNLLNNTFRSYDVYKVDASGNETLLKNITNITDNLYDDLNVVCGEAYNYKVVTNYNFKSTSNILSLTNTAVPPATLGKVHSTVIGGQTIRVTSLEKSSSDLPTFTAFNYYRANSLNGNYSKVNAGVSAFWDDKSINPSSQQYCYYMTWSGGCGESQPSEKICSIFARMQGSTMIWTSEKPMSDPINQYRVFRIDPSTGNPINTPGSGLPYSSSGNSVNLSTMNIPEAEGQTIYLAIEGFPVVSPPSSVSNYVEYQRPALALSALAFTPNGDGINDTFYIQGRFIKTSKMSIFDRWGNLISFIENLNYQSNPQLGWDGTSTNGNKVPAGSYAFQIEVEDLAGNLITKEGSIVVIY